MRGRPQGTRRLPGPFAPRTIDMGNYVGLRASSNTKAISLYEAMGYEPRASFEVVALRPPNR
jgi:hypothetical protein